MYGGFWSSGAGSGDKRSECSQMLLRGLQRGLEV